MSESNQQQQPQVITLDAQNSAQILVQYVELAQKAGAFLLPESDILKRCRDVLLGGAADPEINVPQARQLLIQAVSKGQSKGAYTLDDASILHKVCQYVSANLSAENAPLPPQEQQLQQQAQELQELPSSDLSDLSAPVPLRTPGPKTV
jgi:hypothetical protein